MTKPSAVGFEDRTYQQAATAQTLSDGTWFYDAVRENLQVRVKVKSGEDRVIDIAW